MLRPESTKAAERDSTSAYLAAYVHQCAITSILAEGRRGSLAELVQLGSQPCWANTG